MNPELRKEISSIGKQLYAVQDTDVAHLAGLVDGAGTITVHIGRDKNYLVGYRYNPIVRLSRPQEDKSTLGKLDAYAEDYGVQYLLSEEDEHHTTFKVTNHDSIRRFLEPLMEYLVTRHSEAGLMLHEILPALERDDHQERERFYELVGYADTLRNVQSKGRNPKYTQDYFESEWNVERGKTA